MTYANGACPTGYFVILLSMVLPEDCDVDVAVGPLLKVVHNHFKVSEQEYTLSAAQGMSLPCVTGEFTPKVEEVKGQEEVLFALIYL